jgi:centrosomal protein CEP104
MDFVGKAFNSPNADVRSTAVQVAVAVGQLVGLVMRKYLPADANPKVKEQLDREMESKQHLTG